jgi:hypothetical protein
LDWYGSVFAFGHPGLHSTPGLSYSPLIRLTLLLLYLALMGPLPFLAQATDAAVSPTVLAIGIGLGGLGIYGALGQRVEVDSGRHSRGLPVWIRWLFRGGGSCRGGKPWRSSPLDRAGGHCVLLRRADQQAYLLPMRVAGFARLLSLVETYTDLDTKDIRPLAQPWMYFILLVYPAAAAGRRLDDYHRACKWLGDR